jgi:hypothetical protein
VQIPIAIASFLFLGVRWDSPFGKSATILPTIPALDDDDDDDECGVAVGMTGKANRSTGENLPQYHFVHHKAHIK